MTTTTDKTAEHAVDTEALAKLVSKADDGAAQLAMDVESIADEAEILSRRLAELRADLARQRVVLAELRGTRP
jgi:hypothetical protein